MIVCAPAITAVIVALAIAAPGAGGSELSTALGAIALAGSGDRRPRHLTPDGIERFALNRSGRRSGLGCATSERLGRARRALALDEPQARFGGVGSLSHCATCGGRLQCFAKGSRPSGSHAASTETWSVAR